MSSRALLHLSLSGFLQGHDNACASKDKALEASDKMKGMMGLPIANRARAAQSLPRHAEGFFRLGTARRSHHLDLEVEPAVDPTASVGPSDLGLEIVSDLSKGGKN